VGLQRRLHSSCPLPLVPDVLSIPNGLILFFAVVSFEFRAYSSFFSSRSFCLAMRFAASDTDSRNIESMIRTWIAVAVVVVCWLLPIPWYYSTALFFVALFSLGVFYPLLTSPRK
jgi:hypothetical protein